MSADIEMETVTMPKALSEENGAKAFLTGEFYSEVVVKCEECDGYGEYADEPCGECSGSGAVTMHVPVCWTTIKAIYARAVERLAK